MQLIKELITGLRWFVIASVLSIVVSLILVFKLNRSKKTKNDQSASLHFRKEKS